ncbi:MAG: ATP-binding protein [Methyloligellaceae bacterium]
MRLTFASRIALIIVSGFMALSVGTAIFQYLLRAEALKDMPGLPFVEQIVSMVQLLEKAPPTDRRILLRALNTSKTQVLIKEHKPEPGKYRRIYRLERHLTRFLNNIGGRPVVAYANSDSNRPFSRNAQFFLPTEFSVQISLQTGDYLILNIKDTLNMRLFGIPPGFWAGIFGFLAATFVVIAVTREIGPLKRLAQSVQNFSHNASPVMIEEKGAQEVKSVISAFNQMQRRIDLLMRGRVFMLSAISHDMRTYLTRFRLRVEKVDDPVKQSLISDIEDMSKLIDESLELARTANGHLAPGNINFTELLHSECRKAVVNEMKVEFIGDRNAPAWVYADELSLRRILANLIDNAIKYGDRAQVQLVVKEGYALAQIDDFGPGVPLAERENIFEPFQRLETSRNRATGGAGLGLAIAQELAIRNEGKLSVTDSPTGGARFIAEFPVSITGLGN